MTGMKTPQKSTLLSPTSSKLMTQYIVKTNLNHHYNKLQNAKSRIDNSLPDSMLKSQKVRDRQRQEGWSNSLKSSQRAKSRQSSRPQSQFSNHGDPEEHWMDKYGDDLEAEVERIVQMTLNGRSQELQQVPLYTQSRQDCIKHSDATHKETARSHSRSGQLSSLSRFCVSAQSFVSNSEKLGPDRRPGMSARSEGQDLLNTRAHLFTEPDKPFVPKILKSNRSSLLNQYKYYNPPKRQRQRPLYSDTNPSPSLSSGPREAGKGEAPVPKPRQKQKANFGNTQTLSPKMQYSSEEGGERVPPLDIPADEFLFEQVASSKKSDAVSARNHMKLSESQSVTDLPRNSMNLNKSQSLMTLDGESKDEVKLASDHRIARNNARKKRHMNLTSERSSRLTLKPKEEEDSVITVFMKDVTEEILMKGLYTNRSIQRVFDSHARKRKGQLNEDEMKKLLTKLQKDIGLAQSDIKESPRSRLPSSSISAEVPAHNTPQPIQTGKDPDQDADPLSALMLKEYEEKMVQDESSPVTSEVQSSMDADALRASDEDPKQKVQEFELKNNKRDPCENPGKNYKDESLVEEKPLGSGARKPVPRPRRKSATTSMVGNMTSSDFSSDFQGKKVTENSDPKSEESSGTGFQSSVISRESGGGTAVKEHSKVSGSLFDVEEMSGSDSKPNVAQNKKKDSLKSEGPTGPNTSLKEGQVSRAKPTGEDTYDDDFEDEDDDNVDESDSDF